MLECFVELVVKVGEPELAVLRGALASHRLDDLSYFLQICLPELPIIEEVDVHQLIDHLDDTAVHVAELAVFCNQVSRLRLNLLIVLLYLNRVRPGDHPIVLAARSRAFGVLNKVLKFCCLVDHHWLLTVDHLGTH